MALDISGRPMLLILLAAATFLVIAVVAHMKRRKELEEAARDLGLEFVPDPGRFDRALRAFDAMGAGSNPRWGDMLRGAYRGRPVRCFDFRYSVQQGKSRTTQHVGVILVEVPRHWPRVSVTPETFLHKAADALGMDDLDFESQEFSDRYWVRAEDARFAYALLHPRALELLLEPGVERIEIRDGLMCLWKPGRFGAKELRPALERASRLLDLAPSFLLHPGGVA